MSKKRKTRKKNKIPRSLNQIRKLKASDLSKYTREQLRSIEKKVIKSQNMKIDRINIAGFGMAGRIRDYINKKGKISTSNTKTNKDILIGRIIALNQLTEDSHSSVRKLNKSYAKYNKSSKRYGDITKQQHIDIINIWYDYRNNRLSYKITSEEVYALIQEYVAQDKPLDIEELSEKIEANRKMKKEIIEMKEEELGDYESRIPNPYDPKNL